MSNFKNYFLRAALIIVLIAVLTLTIYYLPYTLSFVCLFVSISLFLRLKPPFRFYFCPIIILTGAISPFLVVLSAVGAGLGWLYHAPVVVAAGLAGMAISLFYIIRVPASQPGFASAFGKDWQDKISPAQQSRLLKRRWGLGLPKTGEPLSRHFRASSLYSACFWL